MVNTSFVVSIGHKRKTKLPVSFYFDDGSLVLRNYFDGRGFG
ncbi:hypothetical protein [Reichenbachiella versicolor]|nr:hypothetical protein [Reichenbachiella versicolor]